VNQSVDSSIIISNNDYVSMNASVASNFKEHDKDWKEFFMEKKKTYSEKAKQLAEENLKMKRINN
jgi:cell division protein FtsL